MQLGPGDLALLPARDGVYGAVAGIGHDGDACTKTRGIRELSDTPLAGASDYTEL
jgi:hypothetical protein